MVLCCICVRDGHEVMKCRVSRWKLVSFLADSFRESTSKLGLWMECGFAFSSH